MITKEVYVTRVRDFLHEIARLNKKAARIGVAQIVAEDLGIVSKTRTLVTVDEDGNEDSRTFPIDVNHFRLTLPEPADCQWEPIAKITPTDEGAFAEPMPAGTQADADRAKSLDPQNCDHCHTRRDRSISYVVRHKADHRVLQLGRNCFEDYVGKDTLRALEFQAVIMSSIGGDEDGYWGEGGGWRGPVSTVALRDCVAFAEMLFRTNGWQNNVRNQYSGDLEVEGTHRIAARIVRDLDSTSIETTEARKNITDADWAAADVAIERLTELELPEPQNDNCPRCGNRYGGETLYGKTIRCAQCGHDYEMKGADKNEFAHTLKNLADYQWVPTKKAALAAYIGQFLRQLDRKAREAALNGKRVYVGTVGKRETFANLTCVRCHGFETDYGYMNINVFNDPDGNVLIWKTGSVAFNEGQKVTLKGTVKEHSKYRDTKQTVLTRCKEVAK